MQSVSILVRGNRSVHAPQMRVPKIERPSAAVGGVASLPRRKVVSAFLAWRCNVATHEKIHSLANPGSGFRWLRKPRHPMEQRRKVEVVQVPTLRS